MRHCTSGPRTDFQASDYGAVLLVDPEDEMGEAEKAKLERDVKDEGLSLVVFTEWYSEDVMTQARITGTCVCVCDPRFGINGSKNARNDSILHTSHSRKRRSLAVKNPSCLSLEVCSAKYEGMLI